MADDKRTEMIAKVQKLWALADRDTTPEHERAEAVRLARDLMSKYQIDEMVLQEKTHTRDAVVLSDILVFREGRKDPAVPDQRMILAHYIATRNRCKSVIRRLPDSVAKDGSPIRGGMYITVCGFKSDVDTVRAMYDLLSSDMMTAMFMEPTDHMNGKNRTNYFANFADGYAMRIDVRLSEIGREVERAFSEIEDGKYLPALVEKGKEVASTFNEMFPNLSKQKVSRYVRDPNAQERGKMAANNADLGQGKVGGGGRGEIGAEKKGLGRG